MIIEIPHYASLRGLERDVTVMRSDDGSVWREHHVVSTVGALSRAMDGSFEGETGEGWCGMRLCVCFPTYHLFNLLNGSKILLYYN